MTKQEKIRAIQYALDNPNTEELYYDLLGQMGDLKTNYWEYMTTEPINCDNELKTPWSETESTASIAPTSMTVTNTRLCIHTS